MVLAWVTFLAGGVYPWVWVPAAVRCSSQWRSPCSPTSRATERVRALDITLIAVVLACARAAGADADRAAFDRSIRTRSPCDARCGCRRRWRAPDLPWIPISIAPRDTLAAAGILLSAIVMFWTCRRVCEQGGTGRIVRAVAFIGLVASIAAIVQRAQRIELLYGVWRPLDTGARPYGPFVNRNHFATWVIMACPLVFGYLLARAPRHEARDVCRSGSRTRSSNWERCASGSWSRSA